MAIEPALSLSPEKVCFIILKARALAAKDVESDPDSGSNPTDDGMIDVLEDQPDDPTAEELAAFIDSLNEDEQIDLVALAWLGRDGVGIEDWPELRAEAGRSHREQTAAYLLGMPLMADHLEGGLAFFGETCTDVAFGRL